MLGTAVRWLEPHRRVLLVAVVAVAVLLRVGFVAAQSSHAPHGDAADYDRHAVSLVLHGEYPASGIAPSGGPTAFRPPAYTYLLAGVYGITDTVTSTDRFVVARILSAVLGAAAVGLVGVIAWLLWDWLAALATMAIAAVYPPLVTVGDAMLSEALFTPLVLAAVAAALAARRSPRRVPWAVLAGGLVGLLSLTRTNGIVVFPVIAAGIWARPRLSRRSLTALAAFTAATLAVMAPWAVRNTLAFHQLVPISTQAGFTLAGTYNDVSRGYRPSPAAWRAPTMPPYLALRRPRENEATIERRFRSTALSYAESNPGYVAKVAYFNLGRLLELQGPSTERAAAPAAGISRRTSDLDVYAFYLLAVLTVAAIAAGALRRTPAFVWAVPLALTLSLVFVIAYMRYRLPIDPFLVLLVGGAIAARVRRQSEAEATSRSGPETAAFVV
jgi:4-amino-4-deoxy-L-arabinose transferase-like glycosyltransferase